MTDPIADMLTQIRNASALGYPRVIIPFSKLKFALAKILKKEGYLGEVKELKKDTHPQLKIALKYTDGQPIIRDIKRISKSGRRVYVQKNRVPYVRQGFGLAIISTSQGLITDREARKRKVGGEIICQVW